MIDLPARVEPVPGDDTQFRLYGENGTVDDRIFDTREEAAAVRDRLNGRPDIYIAVMESESFSWLAVGRTEDEARDGLRVAWAAHMNQYGTRDGLSADDALEQYGCNIHEARFGIGLRDGEEVTA